MVIIPTLLLFSALLKYFGEAAFEKCPHDGEKFSKEDRIFAMDGEDLGRIEAETLAGLNEALPQLESVVLRNISIEMIEEGSFRGLKTVLCVDLSANRLGKVARSHFRGLRSLRQLQLSNNKISMVEDSAFLFVRRLVNLNLAGNLIPKLTNGAFRGLNSLETLDLSNNRLSTISRLQLFHMENLQQLDVSNNPLTQIDASSLTKLNTLWAENTFLTTIPAISTSVKELNLKNSRISRIGPRFPGYSILQLSKIFLSDNPFLCDCAKNGWFLRWAKNTENLVDVSESQCENPATLKGLKLSEAAEKLNCKPLVEKHDSVLIVPQVTLAGLLSNQPTVTTPMKISPFDIDKTPTKTATVVKSSEAQTTATETINVEKTTTPPKSGELQQPPQKTTTKSRISSSETTFEPTVLTMDSFPFGMVFHFHSAPLMFGLVCLLLLLLCCVLIGFCLRLRLVKRKRKKEMRKWLREGGELPSSKAITIGQLYRDLAENSSTESVAFRDEILICDAGIGSTVERATIF